MNKLNSIIVGILITIGIAGYAVSQTCYDLLPNYVGYFCNDIHTCSGNQLGGLFNCCQYRSNGYTVCNEGGTDVYYELRIGTTCSTVPCCWAGSDKYCNYGQSAGYPDPPHYNWVAQDTLGGVACP